MDMRIDISAGLTAAQVDQRKADGLSNGSFDVRTKSVGRILKDNIFTLFNLINVILALLVALTGSYRNMLFMGVVISNCAIGVIQELRSKRVIDRLSLISAPKAHVIRGGEGQDCAVSEVVRDDILLLTSGSQICVDCEVVQGSCEVDESLLTGESDPVTKEVGDELLSGSFVVSGTVTAQAIRVGADSYANTVTGSAKYIKKRSSGMMRSIDRIICTISVCIVPFSLLLFFKAIFVTDQDPARGIVSTVAALIGMIPEGLLLLTSIALAVSAVRLARKNTLCQDLYCVEQLARVDVLCLDKTGTLTEGSMEVKELIPLDNAFDIGQALCALCSASDSDNPTMSAIRARFGAASELNCIGRIPFSSARKLCAAEFDGHGCFVIGAPDFILPKAECDAIMSRVQRYSSDGMRILLLGQCEVLPDNGAPLQNVSPKALLVLSDKIRATAPQTLDYFRKQGVAIKVISGDDPVTVSGVAKRAGLDGYDSYVDASVLSDEQLISAAESFTIFGRVTPQQKLLIIKALRSDGHTVAMTGDGVNDVLALREADCSIAMQSGSDAARCVSQLVLLDSDFASLPLVVQEGRRVINNIQRSAALFLVKTVFSFMLAVVFMIVPFAYPFQPIQMTLISALAIGIPSFILALQTNKNRVQGSFISSVLKRAFPGGISVTLGVILLIAAQSVFSLPQEQISTAATYLTATVCFAVLFGVCRPFDRLRAVMLTALIAVFCAAVLLFPSLFYIVPLSAECAASLAVAVCLSLAVLALLTVASNRLFGQDKEISFPASAKKAAVTMMVLMSAVFAVWFSALMADYIAVASGGRPVAAREMTDGSFDGVLYSISNGEIHIFGNDVAPEVFIRHQ